jgi:2-succinyl-5-enolpyruvyl-6-hydroxy-3-cyclohexene-1-carboxylate synthase
LNLSEKVLLLGGQTEPNQELIELLNQLDIPIVGDVISNLHGLEGVINSSDLIFKTDDEFLAPDFLITFGRSVISKNLKLYLRKNKPKVHWHIGEGMVGDPFQSLTKIIKTPLLQFFTDWLDMVIKINDQDDYCNLLKDTQKSVDEDFDLTLDNAEFNYFNAVRSVLKQLPQNSVLHLGNSMPVRIANFIGIKESTIDIWCNRGTSGIDGVVSTAVGHALAEPNRKHTLIIGDLSFFYDRNGLWLNHEFPTNLQIVILNDNGGGIFNMIPGPSNQDGLTNLFTTPHQRTAKLTAQEFKLTYRKITSLEEIDGWSSGILEIFTEMQNNMETFKRITTKARRKLN